MVIARNILLKRQAIGASDTHRMWINWLRLPHVKQENAAAQTRPSLSLLVSGSRKEKNRLHNAINLSRADHPLKSGITSCCPSVYYT